MHVGHQGSDDFQADDGKIKPAGGLGKHSESPFQSWELIMVREAYLSAENTPAEVSVIWEMILVLSFES